MALRPTTWTRALTALTLVGACTVVDKADYTFTDDPESGGEGGTSSGGTGGSTGGTGNGGSSGEAGEASGGTTGGTSGEAGSDTGGTGGGGGDGGDGDGGPCDPNPCENEGVCSESGSTARCDCAPGYTGETCADEIDECDPNPCLLNAMCTDLLADFSCECPPQATGKRCHLPRFQPIPPPPALMGQATLARAVSADGTVVLGEVSGPLGTNVIARPFVWTAGEGSRIVPLPSSIRADVTVRPWSISGDGAFWVGDSRTTSSNGPPYPIGGPTVASDDNEPLPMFMLPSGAIGGFAFDTNADGTRSVGNFTDSMGNVIRAVRYDAQGMPSLLPNPYGLTSPLASANAITRDGAIIAGTAKDAMSNVFVVFWGEAGATAPGQVRTMTGVAELEVHGTSHDAAITAGTWWDSAYSNFAFMTRGTQFIPLAGIAAPPVTPRSNAWDVSDDGNFIVGETDYSMTGSMLTGMQAVVWKASDGSFRTLVDILRESNVTLAGWVLSTLYGVSADGKVVVGVGTDPMGVRQGFIARLP